MARDTEVIQDEILQEKENNLNLQEANSDSKVSIYNAWANVQALAIRSFEIILDLFKDDIEEIFDNRVNGVGAWYVDMSYKYQDGDIVEVSADGTTIEYPVIDESKRIITRASYSETTVSAQNLDKQVLIKVAKGTGATTAPLLDDELSRFNAYLEDITFLGTNIKAVSREGDILVPRLTIYHNGTSSDAAVRSRVADAIRDYIEGFNFNATLYTSKLIDVVQEVEGVVDVYIDPEATPAQGIFTRYYNEVGELVPETDIGRFTEPVSGYLRESTETGAEAGTPNIANALTIITEL